MTLYQIEKLLLSSNREDNLIAWEILIARYKTISGISRMLFEKKSEIQIFEPIAAGLCMHSSYHCSIGYYNKEGRISYKYIEK